jgi:hypothetical protein
MAGGVSGTSGDRLHRDWPAHPAFTFDVDRALGLTGRGARVLAALFILTQATLAITADAVSTRSWPGALALGLLTAAAVLVVMPGPFPMRRSWTLVVIGVVVVTTILVESGLPTTGRPGYAAWHFGANTFLLLAVGLRGRSGWARLGMALMAGITAAWSVTTGQGVLPAIELIDRQAATLLIGTLFAFGLRRTMHSLQAGAADRLERAAAEESASAALHVRGERLARLEKNVVPSLRSIAAGAELTDADKSELLIIEARLRDTIRGGILAVEPLITSATEARRRGVDLVVLDDTGPARWAIDGSDVVPWVARQLDGIGAGSFTARIAPDATGRVVVTVVADELGMALERVPGGFEAGAPNERQAR